MQVFPAIAPMEMISYTDVVVSVEDYGIIQTSGSRVVLGMYGEVVLEPILWEQLGSGLYREVGVDVNQDRY